MVTIEYYHDNKTDVHVTLNGNKEDDARTLKRLL